MGGGFPACADQAAAWGSLVLRGDTQRQKVVRAKSFDNSTQRECEEVLLLGFLSLSVFLSFKGHVVQSFLGGRGAWL